MSFADIVSSPPMMHANRSLPALTKRDMYAMAAMQGYCAVEAGWNQPAHEVARCAVAMADALLEALGERQ